MTRQHTHTNTKSSSSLLCTWLEWASSNTRYKYCQQNIIRYKLKVKLFLKDKFLFFIKIKFDF